MLAVAEKKLVDLSEVSIAHTLSKEERIKKYIDDIGDPYNFKIGDIEVSISLSLIHICLPVMTPNVYHDVTVTAEGSMIKLYIDGVLSSTLTHGRSLSAILDGDGSGYAGYIAKSPYGGDPPFRGKLADFRIYNKVLSDGEVAALHVESKVLTDQEKADARCV